MDNQLLDLVKATPNILGQIYEVWHSPVSEPLAVP